MNNKTLLILLDGAGDRSFPELGNRTPLQAAHLPALDRLATGGSTGLFHAGYMGQPLPSEIAHTIMFGFGLDDFPGRGVLEALGGGIDLQDGDVAILGTVASIHNNENVLYLDEKYPGITREEMEQLKPLFIEKSYPGNMNIQFIPLNGLSGVIIIKGDASPFFTDTDPMIKGAPLIDLQSWEELQNHESTMSTVKNLRLYLDELHGQLGSHPVNTERVKQGKPSVNFLVTQRAGQMKMVTGFTKRFGIKGLSLSEGPMYRGLCKHLGLGHREFISDKQDPGIEFKEKLSVALELLEKYDVIHVHTKWPDKAAHGHDPVHKKEILEMLDQALESSMDKLLEREDLLVVVAADHSTPSGGSLIHSGEPVPVIFHGQGVRVDQVTTYDEVSAATGCLGVLRGRELFSMILNYMDRTRLAGIVDDPGNPLFWPGNYTAYKLEDDDG